YFLPWFGGTGDVDHVHVLFPDSLIGGLCLCSYAGPLVHSPDAGLPAFRSFVHSLERARSYGNGMGNADHSECELEAAHQRSSGLEFNRAFGSQCRSALFRSLIHGAAAAKLVHQNAPCPHALSVVLSLECRIVTRPAHLSVSGGAVVFLANPGAHLDGGSSRLCCRLRLLRSADGKNRRLAH